MDRRRKEYVAPQTDVVGLDAEPLLAASYRVIEVNGTQEADPEMDALGKRNHFDLWDDEE